MTETLEEFLLWLDGHGFKRRVINDDFQIFIRCDDTEVRM